jgi:hypothetical protein
MPLRGLRDGDWEVGATGSVWGFGALGVGVEKGKTHIQIP